MLTFVGKKIKDIVIQQPDKIATDCKSYDIKKDGMLLSQFYGGDKFSFLQFDDITMRIDRKRRFLNDTLCTIFIRDTDQETGEYKFVRGQTGGNIECVLSFNEVLLITLKN